ncbi:hypothetical protein MHUMG1_08122 [Metarhizium humberi]|uniref:Uncharacterized protein n=1 Tax=Metarhizium humberi TaxID=2596975 RepID=A0A9P8M5F4_9HYPO|nr:hypothetical protein MHUMG1_08122 [Metarhizium humberi]
MKFSITLVTLCIGLVAAAPRAPESGALADKAQPRQIYSDDFVFPDDERLKPKPTPTSTPVPDDAPDEPSWDTIAVDTGSGLAVIKKKKKNNFGIALRKMVD